VSSNFTLTGRKAVMLLLASFWAAIFLGEVCFLSGSLELIYLSFGFALLVVLAVVLGILGLSEIAQDWFNNRMGVDGPLAGLTLITFSSVVLWTVFFFIAVYFILRRRHRKKNEDETEYLTIAPSNFVMSFRKTAVLLLGSLGASILIGAVCFLSPLPEIIYLSFGGILEFFLIFVLSILGLGEHVNSALEWLYNHTEHFDVALSYYITLEDDGGPTRHTLMLFLSILFWTISLFIAGYFTLWWRHQQKKAE